MALAALLRMNFNEAKFNVMRPFVMKIVQKLIPSSTWMFCQLTMHQSQVIWLIT
ncbi:hypothetical protein O9929_22935 [Vibrio lentus]|nr:hypothetical protein [Vibrio lentus]